MGFLDDVPSTQKFRILVESQTGFQDLQIHETQFKEQKEKAATCKSERTTIETNLSQCNLEY